MLNFSLHYKNTIGAAVNFISGSIYGQSQIAKRGMQTLAQLVSYESFTPCVFEINTLDQNMFQIFFLFRIEVFVQLN